MVDYKKLYALTQKMRILLVEDYAPLRQELMEALEDLVHTVTGASDGKEAFALYMKAHQENNSYDMVISDIQMPHMDGVQLTKKIREVDENQVIYILSAYTDKVYLLDLINLHIAKFITKPIDYDTLLSILYHEGQKLETSNVKSVSDAIEFAQGYVWNRQTHILTYQGTVVELTKHEIVALEFFVEKEGYICSSDDIVNIFYEQGIDISERNVRNLIFKLRRKIPEACIQNIYGLGYKFSLLV